MFKDKSNRKTHKKEGGTQLGGRNEKRKIKPNISK